MVPEGPGPAPRHRPERFRPPDTESSLLRQVQGPPTGSMQVTSQTSDGTRYLGQEALCSPKPSPRHNRCQSRGAPPAGPHVPCRRGAGSSQGRPAAAAPAPPSPPAAAPPSGLSTPRQGAASSLRASRTTDGNVLTLRDLRGLSYGLTEKASSKIRKHTDSSTPRNC